MERWEHVQEEKWMEIQLRLFPKKTVDAKVFFSFPNSHVLTNELLNALHTILNFLHDERLLALWRFLKL